ncbi:NAD(P)-dependent alcohol dehydrogenase [Microbacterium sp. M3]|uniref:NAD(P)-dependent alcohol dehydrogenase n=1 Tax=Microbacterium arthrosphaerae TaxID=792652 RepID=A0ABU4H411_9MICO|nr:MULTISPECIES: NAD(P)-dependent alcohol dehydrogenase [Microbacterium]MDW4574074.1 NAD(P)-dependent alcohol dehydrogenase [Microbacterium arthrosphaerae]MDW7607929.1 NAD(P)-dependent alcohol dehydrogenase [Microbacterium sp. M3]
MRIEEQSDAAAAAAPQPQSSGAVTMRAVVQRRYGPPDVLESVVVKRPAPARGEVLVRVAAASVHPGDCFVMTGEPYLVRLVYGLRRPRHGIPGRDFAGVVTEVGDDVTALRPGDEVFGWSTTGSLAEYVCAPADNVAPTPAGLSAVAAAAVPTSAMTALQALRDIAHVRPGQTVLITGASGGVGSFAVQIAKAIGAEVTGVCRTRNIDLVRSLGADHVVDGTATDFTRGGKRYDVILDSVEAQPLEDVRRALAPTGVLIPNSGRGGRWLGPLGRIAKTRVLSAFTRQRLRPFTSVGKHHDLLTLAELIATGQVTPAIDRTYALDDAADALRYVGAGHARGKVVVTI